MIQADLPRKMALLTGPREVGKTTRAIILAGGETNNPLTRYRALPAVPFGSSLRLVDIPLNNCLKAGVNKM